MPRPGVDHISDPVVRAALKTEEEEALLVQTAEEASPGIYPSLQVIDNNDPGIPPFDDIPIAPPPLTQPTLLRWRDGGSGPTTVWINAISGTGNLVWTLLATTN